MPFQPGQSGNPGGRSKGLTEVRDLARKHTQAAINGLAKILKSSESDVAKVSAANALLDRGWGKATQAIEHTGKDGEPLIVAATDPSKVALAILGILNAPQPASAEAGDAEPP